MKNNRYAVYSIGRQTSPDPVPIAKLTYCADWQAAVRATVEHQTELPALPVEVCDLHAGCLTVAKYQPLSD